MSVVTCLVRSWQIYVCFLRVCGDIGLFMCVLTCDRYIARQVNSISGWSGCLGGFLWSFGALGAILGDL